MIFFIVILNFRLVNKCIALRRIIHFCLVSQVKMASLSKRRGFPIPGAKLKVTPQKEVTPGEEDTPHVCKPPDPCKTSQVSLPGSNNNICIGGHKNQTEPFNYYLVIISFYTLLGLNPEEHEGYHFIEGVTDDAKGVEKMECRLMELTEVMHNALKNGHVLVNCQMGISRSVSLVIAYLIRYHKMTFYDAKNYVQRYRPCANPNLAFCGMLVKFEKYLNLR